MIALLAKFSPTIIFALLGAVLGGFVTGKYYGFEISRLNSQIKECDIKVTEANLEVERIEGAYQLQAANVAKLTAKAEELSKKTEALRTQAAVKSKDLMLRESKIASAPAPKAGETLCEAARREFANELLLERGQQ